MGDVEHERWRLSLREFLRLSKHAWHGVKLNQPDWSAFSHGLAISVERKNEGLLLYTALNAYWEALDFELPALRNATKIWRRWIDTALDPPDEICEWKAAPAVPGPTYRVGARSVVVLIAGDGMSDGRSD
jgi:glycogen operon protein